jgi:hypothetical protein
MTFDFRYVFWYHEERMVNYDLSSSSSVSVKTSEDSGVTRSVLTITEAKPDNAGNYTCKPSNAIAASIQVFVSEGTKKQVCSLKKCLRPLQFFKCSLVCLLYSAFFIVFLIVIFNAHFQFPFSMTIFKFGNDELRTIFEAYLQNYLRCLYPVHLL